MLFPKKRSQIFSLVAAMSILNMLFGCKQSSIKGPDFDDVIVKIIHLETGQTVEYEMPGNMAKEFNFDVKYKNESERTVRIGFSNTSEYEEDTWQLSRYVDGASWNYIAGTFLGLEDSVARINFRISAGQYYGDIRSFIKDAYERYLNGPEGPNADARKFGVREKLDLADVQSMLVHAPDEFSTRKVNDVEYLHWVVENESSVGVYNHFLYVIDSENYLDFNFYHYYSARSDEELERVKVMVAEDLDKVMSHVFIRE